MTIRSALMSFLLLLLAFEPRARAQEESLSLPASVDRFCARDSYVAPMPTNEILQVKMMKDAALDGATRDLKSFCEWNRMDRASLDGINLEEYRAAKYNSKRQAEDVLIAKHGQPGRADPWGLAMLGSKRVKDSSPSTQFDLKAMNPPRERLNPEDYIEAFSRPLPQTSKFILPEIEPVKQLPEPGATEKVVGCAYFAGLATADCVKGVDGILDYVKVHSTGRGLIVGLPSIQKVMTDASNAEGIRRAAVKLWSRVHDKKVPPGSNVFDDIQSSFIESGIPAKEAEERTWEFLAIYSTSSGNLLPRLETSDGRGANFNLSDWPRGCGGNNPMVCPAQAIVEAIAKLDSISMSQEKPFLYSLPSSVHFPCDSGKSYHFWMDAYLSRKMAREGISDAGIRAATFLSFVGYSMGGTGTRQPEKIATNNRYGTVENATRIDMTLVAAGAQYGIDSAKGRTRTYDLEQGYRVLLKSGSDTPNRAPPTGAQGPAVANRVSVTLDWLSKLNPNVALNYYDR